MSAALKADMRSLSSRLRALARPRSDGCGATDCPPELPHDVPEFNGQRLWYGAGGPGQVDGELPSCPVCGRTPERVVQVIYDPDFFGNQEHLQALGCWPQDK